MAKIIVQDTEITVIRQNEEGYISLTNIAWYKSDEPVFTINHWMRNRNTIEFLGIWETLYNPNFSLNAFTLSPTKWIERTNAIGIISKACRRGNAL